MTKTNQTVSRVTLFTLVGILFAGCASTGGAKVKQLSDDGKQAQIELSTSKKSIIVMKPMKEALEARDEIDKLKDQSHLMMTTSAELSLLGGQLAEAEARARKVLKADMKNVDAGKTLLKAAILRNKYQEALLISDNLIANDAKNPDLFALKGLAHYLNNEPIDARENWKKALAINSSHVSSQMNLGALYFQNRNYAAAGAMFERVLKSQPQNPDAQVGKALVLSSQGNATEARTTLQAVLERNKESSLVLYNLALIERDRFSNYQASLDYLNKYLEVAKSDRVLVERAVAMREELKGVIAKSEQGKLSDSDLRNMADKSSQATVGDGLENETAQVSAAEPVKTAAADKPVANPNQQAPAAKKEAAAPVKKDEDSVSALEDAIK